MCQVDSGEPKYVQHYPSTARRMPRRVSKFVPTASRIFVTDGRITEDNSDTNALPSDDDERNVRWWSLSKNNATFVADSTCASLLSSLVE